MTSLYELENIQKTHSESFTLHISRLDVLQGEILGLLGPTGAGKSTLIRLLTGLEPPSSGRIAFAGSGFDDRELPLAMRRRIATVHQRPLLLSATLRYNIDFGLRVRGVPVIESRATPILDRLGLTKLAQQDARTLSGGQAQLVAIARALVVEPDVLLLDEPTANLDPAHVALVEEVVVEMQRRRPMTVVWATHNLFQARRVAHRVGLLLNGELIDVCEKQCFFESPSDDRTAQFVQGKMVY